MLWKSKENNVDSTPTKKCMATDKSNLEINVKSCSDFDSFAEK